MTEPTIHRTYNKNAASDLARRISKNFSWGTCTENEIKMMIKEIERVLFRKDKDMHQALLTACSKDGDCTSTEAVLQKFFS